MERHKVDKVVFCWLSRIFYSLNLVRIRLLRNIVASIIIWSLRDVDCELARALRDQNLVSLNYRCLFAI